MDELKGAEIYDRPVPPGTVRFVWCRICGAIFGALTGSDAADIDNSALHQEWHAGRGERLEPLG